MEKTEDEWQRYLSKDLDHKTTHSDQPAATPPRLQAPRFGDKPVVMSFQTGQTLSARPETENKSNE